MAAAHHTVPGVAWLAGRCLVWHARSVVSRRLATLHCMRTAPMGVLCIHTRYVHPDQLAVAVLLLPCRLGVEFVKRPDDGKMKGLAFVKDPDGYWCVRTAVQTCACAWA